MKNERNALVAEFIQRHQQAFQLIGKDVRTRLKHKAAIGHGCFPVLKAIQEHGPLSQHAIAQELGHSDAAISRQVSQLVERGYVVVQPSEESRRQVTVSMTDEGKAFLGQCKKEIVAYLSVLLEEVGDEELRQSIALNQQLITLVSNRKETL